MTEKPELLHLPKRENSSIVLSASRSSLVARARKDIARLTQTRNDAKVEWLNRPGSSQPLEAIKPIYQGDQSEKLDDDPVADHIHYCGDCACYWGCRDAYCHLPTEEGCADHRGWWNKEAAEHVHECIECEDKDAEFVSTFDWVHTEPHCHHPRLWACEEHRSARPAEQNSTGPSELGVLSGANETDPSTSALRGMVDSEGADQWHKKGNELWRHDRSKAVECFLRGLQVAPDHVELQVALASAYKWGWGIARDDIEALRLYRKAAEQGHPRALSSLGNMYSEGRGVVRDYAQANEYYWKAAEVGDANALYCLGKMFYEGLGVERDLTQAAIYYRRAAELDHIAAQQCLSWMYKDGRGVPQSDFESAVWEQRANNALKRE